jgi:AcrR family transcriptional regulator
VAAERGRRDGAVPARRARGSLTPEGILDAAAELVDVVGFAGLSMPMLADHLGSGVTSIYWHFRSKDDLVAALTDRVSREVHRRLPPVGDEPWYVEAEAYFRTFRDLILLNAVYREVFAHLGRFLFVRAAMAPTVLRRTEDGLDIFLRAGMGHDRAVAAWRACSTFTRGSVVVGHDAQLDPGPPGPAPTAPGHPVLEGIGGLDRVVRPDDERFATGLALLLDGIRAELEGA